MNCPICHTRLMPQDIIAHLVEVEGVNPADYGITREPELHDPVWSRFSGFRLSVRRAKRQYICQGCKEPIKKGALHAGKGQSSLHCCLDRCASFATGVEKFRKQAA